MQSERHASSVRFDVVDPRGPEALGAMTAYFVELDRRFPDGFDPGDGLTAGLDQLDRPSGGFIVARTADQVVGCGGVQALDDDTGEIKRMWVHDDWRGIGLGTRLLARLEDECRALGFETVRLDTNSTLTEAIAMYERAGYQPIDRYNDNPYALCWFEKPLGATAS